MNDSRRTAATGADEAAASEARRRYRRERMIPIGPDPTIAPFLNVGEVVLAVRRSVGLERRTAAMASGPGASGDLYLTSARLVLLGRAYTEICLNEIQEVLLSGGRLLLVLRDGTGISLAVDRPQLLRVEIAAVRAAER